MSAEKKFRIWICPDCGTEAMSDERPSSSFFRWTDGHMCQFVPLKTRVYVPIESEGVKGHMPFDMSELCATCVHLRKELTCEAFPDGIPEDVLSGVLDHTSPIHGDHGVVYEPIPSEQQTSAEEDGHGPNDEWPPGAPKYK